MKAAFKLQSSRVFEKRSDLHQQSTYCNGLQSKTINVTTHIVSIINLISTLPSLKFIRLLRVVFSSQQVVVLLIKPIVFMTFSLPSASLDLKVPILQDELQARISLKAFFTNSRITKLFFRTFSSSRGQKMSKDFLSSLLGQIN